MIDWVDVRLKWRCRQRKECFETHLLERDVCEQPDGGRRSLSNMVLYAELVEFFHRLVCDLSNHENAVLQLLLVEVAYEHGHFAYPRFVVPDLTGRYYHRQAGFV